MDVPFSAFCYAIYDWRLNKSDPPQRTEEDWIYIPNRIDKVGGYVRNMIWYYRIAKRSGVPLEKEFMTVKDEKRIPPSYNNYRSSLNDVRRIEEALVAYDVNLPKTENYKELAEAEERCIDNCTHYPSYDEFKEHRRRCFEGCRQPRIFLVRDTTSSIENLKSQAINCMSRHSVASGNGDEAQFEKCVADFADQLVSTTTHKESLNSRISQYLSLFNEKAMADYMEPKHQD